MSKISALTDSGPLNGSELFPIVKSGASFKSNTNDLATLLVPLLTYLAKGDTGPVFNTYTDITEFAAQDVSNEVATLVLGGIRIDYNRVATDESANSLAIESSSTPGTYWVPQGLDSIFTKLDATGSVPRPAKAKFDDFVYFGDFGGSGDGSTINDDAWTKLREWAAERSFDGNSGKIRIKPGRYMSSEIGNLAISYLNLDFEGEVWLINTGPGVTLELDGGEVGAGVQKFRLTGNPKLYGLPGSSHGCYVRGLNNSFVDIGVRGAGAAAAGVYMEWVVDSTLHLDVTDLEGGFYSQPLKGIHLTQRAAEQETSYNEVYVRVSGLQTGIYMDGALGGNLRGTVENCILGLETTVNAWELKAWGMDFESNLLDALDNGRRTQFYGCDLQSGMQFGATANGGTLFGGRCNSIERLAGAKNIRMIGTGYNLAGGTIIDPDSKIRYRDIYDITADKMHDAPRARMELPVGASPYTYTNQSGNEEKVLIYGGAVSQVALSRFAGDPMPVSGQYTLSPGDQMIVTYTEAPAIIVWRG